MTIATVSQKPMSEINTTPLIDVMLILLIMIIMTIPVSNHSLEFDLPQRRPVTTAEPDPVKNKLVVTASGALLWNGVAVSDGQLTTLRLFLISRIAGVAPHCRPRERLGLEQ